MRWLAPSLASLSLLVPIVSSVGPAGKLPAKRDPGIAVGIDEVLKFKNQPGYLLVDARPKNEFEGDDEVWLRKGHIPGAVSFHWARLMEKDNTHKFRPFAQTKAELEAAGITPDKDILCYCGTSREGSLLRFYLRYVAGSPKVRLYEGAWKENVWLKNKTLPAETGPPASLQRPRMVAITQVKAAC